jgi:hypothetical protein
MAGVGRIAIALAALAAGATDARAAGHTCEQVEAGAIAADGELDDWAGLARFRAGPADDAAVAIACAFDARALYVLIDVVDDELVRAGGRPATDDAVAVSLSASAAAPAVRFHVLPGARGRPRRAPGAPRWIRVDDTLTPRGYAVELAVPLGRLPGFGASTPVIAAEILVGDVDHDRRPPAGPYGLRGRLHFATHLPAYRGFLAATRLEPADLRLDTLVDVDAAPGTERVVAGGRFVGLLTDEFGFVELPASSPADVLAVEIVEPSPGRRLILTRTRQRGDNGWRELLVIWRIDGAGRFERLLAHEVGQELDGRRIVDRWAWVPAAGGRRGQRDLAIEVGEVVGWDAAAYARVGPSTDVTPLLTPFGGATAVTYRFDGDAVAGPTPAPPARRSRR